MCYSITILNKGDNDTPPITKKSVTNPKSKPKEKKMEKVYEIVIGLNDKDTKQQKISTV